MLPADEGVIPFRKRRANGQAVAVRKLREACLTLEQGLERPIDTLNEMQRLLDDLYEIEWERRRKQC